MKKVLLILFCLCVCGYSYATTMCARNDTVVVSLDSQTSGTGNGNDAIEWTWFSTFSYGRVSGEATCLSAAEGLGRTGAMGAYYGTGEYSSTFIDTVKGLQDYDADGAERRYCWCKMTHPAVSRWVFYYDGGSASNCASNCADGCGNGVRRRADLRSGVFGSVGK